MLISARHLFLVSLSLLTLGLAAQSQVQKSLNEGRYYLAEKNFDLANKKFDEVLATSPDNIEAMLGKLDVLGAQQKTAEVSSFAKSSAGKLKSNSLQTLTLDAAAKIHNRDIKGAMTDLNTALSQYPKEAYMANYLMGYIQAKMARNNDAAIPYLEKAIHINSDYPDSYYLLGDIYLVKGNSSKVISLWNEYIKRIPQSGARYELVSKTLKNLGGR